MAGPLSPFRPSVPATNDPSRLGLLFCQSSGARSHEDLHRPLLNTLPITVRKSRSRRRMLSAPAAPLVDASHTTDGWKSLDTEHPTYVSAIVEGADVDPWRFVPRWRRRLRPARPGRVLWSGGLRGLGRDPERRFGGPAPHHDRRDRRRWRVEDHPSGDGTPLRHGTGHSRRHCAVWIAPDSSEHSSEGSGHVFARRHLTPHSLPPERCGIWAAARPPQPQKSRPSCRCAAARTTPVFAVSLRCAPVRAPLIRPPRRCASGG
jgi:hypothetical protein